MTPIQITKQSKVFVLTGAGISAESGIATFRDQNGLWEQHRVEDVASPEGWERDAETVWRFYSQRRAQASQCKPNAAHVALARVEEFLGDNLFLCTQNVDGLHEAGGSKRVVHMHGELFRSRCENDECEQPSLIDAKLYESAARIGRCSACASRVRPDIVWFGEMPMHMLDIQRALRVCDLFVTIGSSGAVYPAAGFVNEIAYRQAIGEAPKSVYVGLERPENASRFDECRIGKAGEIVPGLFEFV